jgi:hypothetical protein
MFYRNEEEKNLIKERRNGERDIKEKLRGEKYRKER